MVLTMTRAAIVVIVSMAVPLAVAAQQADAPRIYHAITIDRRSPGEKTLAERIARLDAALLVKVIREPRGVAVAVPRELLGPFADRPGVDPPPLVHTETAVEILEVFKGSPAAGVAGARMIIATVFAREVLNLPWLEALAAFRAAAVDAESLN
jgi:hypothetical protein